MSLTTSMQASQSAPPSGRGLGLSLLVIATAQLMLVLDDTIANIALPSIQRELAVSPATLPWIINAYILAFGGLLLFGGRVGDLFGRRRVFRAGLGLFTLASVLAGLGVLAEGERNVGRLDTPGALTGTGAMVALTYGITHAAERGWGNAVTLGFLGAALVLTLVFLWLQARGADPTLPLGLFRDRNRSGSYATMLFVGAGLMGTFYLLALYLQQALGFS